MNYEERNEKSGVYRHFRSSLDIGMGILYLVVGGAVATFKYFGTMVLSNTFSYVFGGLMLLYGAFRIYRGIQGMRMKKRDMRKDFPDLGNEPHRQ